MSLHEAILQRLKDFDEMFNQHGMWSTEDYETVVMPLHQALLVLAQAELKKEEK